MLAVGVLSFPSLLQSTPRASAPVVTVRTVDLGDGPITYTLPPSLKAQGNGVVVPTKASALIAGSSTTTTTRTSTPTKAKLSRGQAPGLGGLSFRTYMAQRKFHDPRARFAERVRKLYNKALPNRA